MELELSEIVITLTGWTIVLIGAAVAAVFAVNNRFDTIHIRIDALQDLILQNIAPHLENQHRE